VEVRASAPRALRRGERVTAQFRSEQETIPCFIEEYGGPPESLFRFRLSLPEGTYRLEVTTTGGLAGEAEVDVRARATVQRLEIRLE
jgi:hypothetical protein